MGFQQGHAKGAAKAAGKNKQQSDTVDEIAAHMMTRVQVARACDVSLSLVRKWERESKLRVSVVTTRAGIVHVFDRRDVEQLRVERAKKNGVKGAHASGELAAHVFAQLEAGERPIAIVTSLRVHPDVVEHCAKQWARMRGAVLVDVAQLDELAALNVNGHHLRAEDAAQLVEQMKRAVDAAHPCVRCSDATARFCADCLSSSPVSASRPSQASRPRPRASRA